MNVFSEKVKSDLREKAVGIGDRLIARSIKDEYGLYWETLTIVSWDTVEFARQANENIYSGVSGIILFFRELYLHTRKEQYREVILSACEWLIHYTSSVGTGNYAFITGRMGTAYAINQIGILFDLPRYRDYSLSLARESISFIRSHPDMEYLNGVAGTAWGLLLLYESSREEWILSYLREAVEKIVTSTAVYREGLYWDRNESQVRGLCGFSHGSSGVAGLFCELGFYFDDTRFYSLSDRALRYENYFFDDSAGQWPDYRKCAYAPIDRSRNEERYVAKDLDFFYAAKKMSAWCHGNTGICLAQERFNRVQAGRISLRNLHIATEAHISRGLEIAPAGRIPYDLCHGGCGNLDFFLNYLQHGGAQSIAVKEYLGQAVDIFLYHQGDDGRYLSGYTHTLEEDESLFTGVAGIGHFALRCLDPGLTGSILYPEIKSRFRTGKEDRVDVPAIDCPDIIAVLMFNHFPKTLAALATASGKPSLTWAENSIPVSESKISQIALMLRQQIGTLSTEAQKKECLDYLRYEKYKLKRDAASNNFFLFTQSSVNKNQLDNLVRNRNEICFQLNPQAKIFTIRREKDELYFITYPTFKGMEELKISRPMASLLRAFRTPKKLSVALQELLELFADTHQNRAAISERLEQQLTGAISAGLLTDPAVHQVAAVLIQE